MELNDLADPLKSIYSVVLLILLWEFASRSGLVHWYFLPPFSAVLGTFFDLLVSGEMLTNTYLTLKRAFVGLVIASLLGVTIGVLSVRSAVVDWFFDPLITIGYPIPKITLIPVFMLWFGIDDTSKIVLVATSTFFPIVVNARHGAREVDEVLIWSAKMMGTSDRKLVRKVILPAAAPAIVTGIQIGMPMALISTFVFEMVAGGGGLGALEILGIRDFETTQVFASLIAIAIVGLVLDYGLRELRGRLLEWT